MKTNVTKLMEPQDYNEWCLLKRRIAYLEMKSSYVWGDRPLHVARFYSDVKDGIAQQLIDIANASDKSDDC